MTTYEKILQEAKDWDESGSVFDYRSRTSGEIEFTSFTELVEACREELEIAEDEGDTVPGSLQDLIDSCFYSEVQ